MATINAFDNGGYHASVIEPKIASVESLTDFNVSNISSTSNTSANSSNSLPPPVPAHGSERAVYLNDDLTTPYRTHQESTDYYDNEYLPESSFRMAILAGQKREERLAAPIDPNFPPVTVENINYLRDEANRDKSPEKLFFFARYLLLACVKQLKPNSQNPERTRQLKDSFNQEGIKIIKKLASYRLGFAEAQFFLGNCYGNGLYGLKQDTEKAFSLYCQGAKLNHPGCTYRAAVCYEVGLGTKRDTKFAMLFYRKAANLSDPSAMYKLGSILLQGLLGQSANPREAISWFVRASQIADEEHPESLHELGLLYENTSGEIPSVIPDMDYARDLFSQAARLGYAPSQYKLGLAYENGFLNCPIDPKRSIAWYSRAAEQENPEAELALSGWYLTGAENILQQHDVEAYLWAKKAANQGLPKAEYAVGYYLETGIGVRSNLTDAKEWYVKAAAHGDERAKSRLASIDSIDHSLRRRPTRDKHGKPNSKDTDCKIM